MKYLAVGILSLSLMACQGGKNQTNIELIQDMMDQLSLKAQDYDLEKDQVANRVPPEGTVAQNREHYPYWTDPEAAGRSLRNPIGSGEMSDVGAGKYRIYCGLCHGQTGAGDGQIAEFMTLKPPSLLSDKVRNFPDGRIFHIITAGQGVMGPYATQITKTVDRWAIVNHIRKLQSENGGN